MSTAEVSLGAKLYVDAVKADMPALLKSGEAYAELRGSFRELGQWLVASKAVRKDRRGAWVMDNAAISAIGEEKAAEFGPIYSRTIDSHRPVLDQLTLEGRGAYADGIRSIHMVDEFEVAPDVVSVVREEDLARVAAASLDFLDAAHRDPANAAFVPGADSRSLQKLAEALAAADYLLPGENPDRKAPLGEQTFRGTLEQGEDIFFSAAELSANMRLPEVITPGNPVLGQAIMLQRVVNAAEYEQVEVTHTGDLRAASYFDSDLTRRDAEIIHDLVEASLRLADASQFDTDSLDQLMYPAEMHDQLALALRVYDDNMVGNALKQRDFQAPGISAETAKHLVETIDVMRDLVELGPEATRFTGDDGAELTDPGATFAEADAEEHDSVFDGGEDEIINDLEASDDRDEAEMGASEYGSSDSFVRGSRETMDKLEVMTSSFLSVGAGEALAALAGKSERSLLTMSAGRDAAAFATMQEAMGAGRRNSTPEIDGRIAENMSLAVWNRMPASRRESMRVVVIEPGKGAFEGYRTGHDSSVRKRVRNFVKGNMLKEDGSPNLVLRGTLRQAASMPIVGASKIEAEAWRAEAERFVASEKAEFELRQEKIRAGRDLKSIDVPVEAAKRFVNVALAAETERPAKLILGEDGKVVISHEDAPRIDARLDRVGNLEKMRPGHQMGLIQVDAIRAAVETGARAISIRVEDDHPYGVVGKADEAERQNVKPKARHADIVLS